MQIHQTIIILYVEDQELSCKFYQKLLRKAPILDVPGMSEFEINEHLKIGIMPNAGIAKILEPSASHPATGTGIPRCELYFYVASIEKEFENAIQIGAKLISPIQERDWGEKVGYLSDPDGHIVAFAEKLNY
ncbi:MAG TPA: hypothetical protein PKX92_06010 [Edaphocola sp.]|nr:hypothetical protein [Edaphocola sp.]